MRGEDALRKSKAADPGADHALGSSSADEVVEGVSEPLVVLLPFVKAAGRCLLSVMVALGLGREDEVGWKCCLWRIRSVYLRFGQKWKDTRTSIETFFRQGLARTQ